MKRRINLFLSLIAILAILSTSIGVTIVYYNIFSLQVQESLKQNALLLKKSAIFSKNDEITSVNSKLNNFSKGKLRITWIDFDGKVLFDNDVDKENLANHINRPEIKEALEKGEGKSKRNSNTMNMDTYYYAIKLDNNSVLRVSVDAYTIFSVLLKALPVIIIIAVVILLLCILLGQILTFYLMKPIKQMSEHLDENVDIFVYKELKVFADKIRLQHENILEIMKSKQDFTANVSHELKTPITAISGYAELIEYGLVEEEKIKYIASQIKANSDRLQSLIQDILQLSKLDQKELPLNFEKIDLCKISKDCINLASAFLEKRSIFLDFVGEKTIILADKKLITELITNLIQNAILYNKDNGKIFISVKNEDNNAVFAIKDTGIGIESEHLEHIFERFYRVDKSRSRENGGTGLGLAIVKHIAKVHNAQILIDSKINKGTEIKILFS